MKKILIGLTITFLLIFLLIYFSLYFSLPGFVVKPDMQNFLNENFETQFKITGIDKVYCPDFLHQFSGYEIEIEDAQGLKISGVYITNQFKGEWELFRGSNIERQYEKAKNRVIK